MWFNWFVVKKEERKTWVFLCRKIHNKLHIFALVPFFNQFNVVFSVSFRGNYKFVFILIIVEIRSENSFFQCRRLRFFRCNNKYLFFRSVECWFLMGHLNLECKLISRFLPSIFIKIDWKINFKTNCSPTGLILFKLYHFYY